LRGDMDKIVIAKAVVAVAAVGITSVGILGHQAVNMVYMGAL